MSRNDKNMNGKSAPHSKAVADKMIANKLQDCVMADEELEPMQAPAVLRDKQVNNNKNRKLAPKAVLSSSSIGFPPSFVNAQQHPLEHAPDQPGAFRMSASGNMDEDQTAVTAQVEGDRIIEPSAAATLPQPAANREPLVNAELVVEEELRATEGSDHVDLEQGSRRNADNTTSSILTAAPMEDKQIISHLLQQRRVRIFLIVAALLVILSVVGMAIGFSTERSQDSVIVIENGTQTIITDDAVIEGLIDPNDDD